MECTAFSFRFSQLLTIFGTEMPAAVIRNIIRFTIECNGGNGLLDFVQQRGTWADRTASLLYKM